MPSSDILANRAGPALLRTCWLSRTEGRLPVWSESTARGIDSRLGAADHAQLAQHVAHVPLDCARTHVQVARNLLVATPLRQQHQHLALPLRQLLGVGLRATRSRDGLQERALHDG